MDLAQIRRLVITALFSDDELTEKFVLKGGNALNLIYGIGERSSLDIDCSIPDDFDDIQDAEERIRRALEDRFDSADIKVFDFKFSKKPSVPRDWQSPRWGGYLAEFKLIEKARFDKIDLDLARRSSITIGPGQQRVFRIEISKFEFCAPKQEHEVEAFTVYVYSLPMIAIEKLRAICQQMPEYAGRRYTTARARDFYDIYVILTNEEINLTTPENIELLRNIFAAKDVPISLLAKIEETKDFHVVDWPAVQQATSVALKDFDFYFDYTVEIVNRLKALGVV
jgi:predicted nucleotidyltransferase component of viral defense system